MRVEDVVDQGSLTTYLSGLPIDVQRLTSLRVAFYAAMSVAPYGLRFFAEKPASTKRGLTCLPIFGALSNNGVAGSWPTPLIDGPAAFAAAMTAARVAADDAASAAAGAAAYAAASAVADAAAYAAASAVSDAAADAAADAVFAAAAANFWKGLRGVLAQLKETTDGPLFAVVLETEAQAAWDEAQNLLKADNAGGWLFWIIFYERALAGKNIHSDKLAPILNKMTERDWLSKDTAEVNKRFQPVLDVYLAEDDGEQSRASQRPTNSTQHVRAIRSQVSKLRDFLDVEYIKLSGHNARNPEQDDVLELLRDLKAIVDKLMERLDDAEDEGRALVVVQENLPAVVEKAGELAIVEAEPLVSATTVTMAATIKMLVDAGADPKSATQIAMGDAAAKKLSPSWRRPFPWLKKLGDSE